MQCYGRRPLTIGLLVASTMLGAARVDAASVRQRGVSRPRSLLQSLSYEVLRLLNADRARAGSPPLLLDRQLTRVATAHSDDMAAHHYLGHDAPNGADPFDRMVRDGIHFTIAAENVGFSSRCVPAQGIEDINADMMAEPLVVGSHRANIVDRQLTRVGIGLSLTAHDAVYLTEDFTN